MLFGPNERQLGVRLKLSNKGRIVALIERSWVPQGIVSADFTA
jgi:hypothetical protein